MKLIKPIIVALVGLASSAVVSQAQGLNFSSSPGSTIQFNGGSDSFQFNPSTFTGFGGAYTNTQWFVGSENGGTGSAVGLFGSVGNGPFSYGPVTGAPGALQSALVLGPLGALDIKDGSGFDVTGSVDWVQINTFNFSGALNASLVVNISDLSYAVGGSNPDLLSLVAGGSGQVTLTFQFSPGETLDQLSHGSSPFTTSYSGSISPTPEPTTVGLLLLGLGGVITARVFRKTNAKAEDKTSSGQI
jgi:hypothetical protein